MCPKVVVGVPVVLAPEAAVSDGERGGVTNSRSAPEIEDIVIDVLNRHGVLDACVAIYDHG